MAKDKDRTLNPAAQQRKLEKQKAVKKGKAAVTAQRNERLSTRNPTRLESQISSLHTIRDSQGGKLKPREQKQLEDLEKDVARIKKAREAVGAPAIVKREYRENDGDRRRGGGGDGQRLGKRRWDDRDGKGSESETTDEEVRRIPWPRDTPPPVPRQPPRQTENQVQRAPQDEIKPDTTLPARPMAPVRTTYESKAQVRDLQKEATQKFVPGVVKRKIDAVKGKAGLIGEEELEKLEGEGYGLRRADKKDEKGVGNRGEEDKVGDNMRKETSKLSTLDEQALQRLKEEEAAFEREIAEAGGSDMDIDAQEGKRLQPTVEEASDEDA